MINLADLKVFIVDDDNYCRDMLHCLLVNQGFSNIQQFSNGIDCITNLSNQPDFIFLDYNMDPLNGLQVLLTAKTICPNAICMMVSAQNDINIAVAAIKAGATDYVIKDEHIEASLASKLDIITKKYRVVTKPSGLQKRI